MPISVRRRWSPIWTVGLVLALAAAAGVSTGAVVADVDRSRTIFSSSAAGPLDNDFFSVEFVGEEPPPLELSVSVELSGIGASGFPRRTYTSDAEETLSIGRGSECEGVVTYRVEFLVA